MRSVSVQMSCVSARSSSLRPGSSSWAAPRMPDSGFLISCASTAAMPDTERAAARCVSWRSIICAIERCCSISTIRPGCSGMRAGEHVDQPVHAAARQVDLDAVLVDGGAGACAPARPARSSGLEKAMMSGSVWRFSMPWLSEKKVSAAALA